MNNKTRSPIQFKRMLSLLMTFFVLALSISGVSGISGFSTTASAASNGFYVNGTSIYDANGNIFKMRGSVLIQKHLLRRLHLWEPTL